jgi:hypothetical protein
VILLPKDLLKGGLKVKEILVKPNKNICFIFARPG